MSRLAVVVLALGLSMASLVGGGSARADDATETARAHYETGLELFYARDHAQALIEFQRAHEVKPRPATLFMMAQCEYMLGSLRLARDHYEAYLTESPTGEFVEVAKDRIESINHRSATLVINAVPDQVDVRVTPAPVAGTKAGTGPAAVPPVITGQAPNNFSVPRGHWVISVSKPNFASQSVTVDVEVAETKPLFFKLEPIPARLEVETIPAGATLYVNGNRARNPYRQDVPPGHVELFAEATDYQERTEDLLLGPGEKRQLVGPNAFHLRYVQRSGRPEIVVASAVMGALVGAGAVAAGLGKNLGAEQVSSWGFALGGALTGAVAGVLVANNFVPTYIPDNRGLFVIGGMWIGTAEGALTGMVLRQGMVTPALDGGNGTYNALGKFKKHVLSSELRGAFLGGLPGLLVGTTVGALTTNNAPTYGRVALIQSAAAGGALVGALTAVRLRWNPFGFQQVVVTPATIENPMPDPPHLSDTRSELNLALPVLIGLNVGLGAGLLGAYLPDQSRYGPSWRRIALIDLAAGAGALAGGIAACVANSKCVAGSANTDARASAAGVALLAGAGGLVAGIILTRKVDRDNPNASPSSTPPPMLGLLPAATAHGGMTPLLSAMGYF